MSLRVRSGVALHGWRPTGARSAKALVIDTFSISKHALHRLTAERRIPFSQEQSGARCYFQRSDLDTWRENGARGPR